MPRPSPSRDRLLRFTLGRDALNVLTPAVHTELTGSRFDLSRKARVTHSWAYKTFDELERRRWIRIEDRVRVRNAPALFAWWKTVRTKPAIHGLHASDPRAAAHALQHEHGIGLAVTTYYAEAAYQGHLFPRRLDAYVRQADLAKARRILVEELDAKIGGTSFRLLTGDDAILDEVVTVGKGEARTDYAPFPQVVLDLLTEGASAGEAAEMMIQRAYPHATPTLR